MDILGCGGEVLFDNMLMGTHFHSMDAKGRMNFPTKIKDVIGETFVITKGFDDCIFVYSVEDFQILVEKIKALPLSKGRKLQRFFMASACEITVDKLGRIVIPQPLREHANLEREIVVVGVSDRAEIWDKSSWEEINNNVSQEEMDEVMEDIDF